MLEVKDLRFSYADKQLFNDANLRIFDGEHVGLVGSNGVGKTTLMNLLASKLLPDSGEIIWDKGINYSYLDQHLKIYDDKTINEYLCNVYEELFIREEQMNSLYKSLEIASVDDYDKILNKASIIQDYLDENNFYMIKSKISNIINGLGIDIEENRLLKNLSGGQRAKVFLGKMLLEEKDVLLLDEPTNFLDAHHVEWLSKYLTSYKNSFIVISHNNSFLNDVCNVIVALENKTLTKYKGNYDAYIKQRTLNLDAYEKAYEKQQKLIKRTNEFIDKNIVRASTTKQAQSRRHMLEHMDILEKPQVEKDVHFDFKFTKSFNMEPLIVKDLVIGYNHPILSNINISMRFGEKYVIVGKNGVGKTTFIKTILGEIKPLSGNVNLCVHNNITYFCQEVPIKKESAIQYFRNDYPLMDDKEIRAILARYGIFGELALKTMDTLSGGEIAKVRFAKLSLEKSNLLILDEPTNHLDKKAKQSLFQAINKYSGTVILVSHEKEFYKTMNMKEIIFR